MPVDYAIRFNDTQRTRCNDALKRPCKDNELWKVGLHDILISVNGQHIATYTNEAEVDALVAGLLTADPSLNVELSYKPKKRKAYLEGV